MVTYMLFVILLYCIHCIQFIDHVFLSFDMYYFLCYNKAKLLVPRDHSERIGTVCSALEES